MVYEKQTWNKYDDLKSEEENIQNGAVVTDNRMNHIEEGISDIDQGVTLHVSNQDNPHSVTKEQVGLGNVSNFELATEAEATDGTSNTKYMTPSLTKKAAKLYVDKTDVGLPNVDNVKQASKTEFDAHATNKNNPHEVTAAQLGTYTKTEADTKFKAINDLILSQDIPEGSNLDDYKKEGEFSKKTPTVVTGAPEGVTGAFRLSVRTMLGSSGIFQTLYDYATRAIYYRIGNASIGFNLPWQKTVTTDETGITRVDKLEVTDNPVYGVTTNNGWYEEKLGDNFYRWTQIFKVSANIAAASGSLFNSDTLTIPAAPTGATDTNRTVTISAAPWPCWAGYFATAGGFRLFSTVVRAAGEVTLEAVLYGSKK